MVAVNLTMFIWDLVERGEIDWDPENDNAIVDSPLHHNLILKAWHASLWLAGLTDDPRFSLEKIAKDLDPTPMDRGVGQTKEGVTMRAMKSDVPNVDRRAANDKNNANG